MNRGTRMRDLLAALVMCIALAASAELPAQSGSIRPDVEQLLDEGLSLFDQGKLAEAQAKFEKALMLDITSEEALAWVEKVGLHQLIQIIDAQNPALQGQMTTLLDLTSVEARRRENDSAKIDAELASIFSGGERSLEQERTVISAINTHGVYLLPGLVARTADADQPVRVRAILMITKLSDDAVLPLSRVLQSSEVRQVQAAIAALQAIGSPEAIPSLLRAAESHSDSLVQQAAREAAKNLGAAEGQKAYDALLAQANRFYNDSNHMVRTYHDPILWKIDGEQLSYSAVEEWALNELRADQLIGDAISLDPKRTEAKILDACNRMARYAEYRTVRDVVAGRVESGDAEESRLVELRALEADLEKVRTGAYALPHGTLLAATDLAIAERRPEVVVGLIEAIRSFTPPGTRATAVPEVLGKALRADHRGVRFAAAECLAYLNPTTAYEGGAEVVRNLAEGLTQAGRRVALTVFPDEDDHLHVASVLERANITSYNDPSAIGGLQRALTFPKDLIVLSPGLPDMPTAELIRRLREDYRTRTVPIILLSEDDKFAENEATYASAEKKVLVVNRSVDPLRLRDDLLAGVLADESRARDEAIAARASEALRFLATRETAFDLGSAEDAIVQALENPADSVRIPACQAIASRGIRRAGPVLLRICQEGEANSVALRVAALNALGHIHRGGAGSEGALAALLQEASASSEVAIQQAATTALGLIGSDAGPAPAVYKGSN